MAYAPGPWTSVTLVNTETTSAAIDLKRVFDIIQVDFPAMNSCSISFEVSRTVGGTYNALGNSVAANIGTGSIQDVYKLGGHQFIKLVSSVTQNADRAIFYRGIGT